MAELANEQTLSNLSWYAQAAYATRCARRAQPLYVTTNREAREGLERVIVASEEYVQGTGGAYVPGSIFTVTSFPDLSFEMAPAVYTSFAAAQVCEAAGNDLSSDDATIPAEASRAATIGLRAYQRTTFAPGEPQRSAAIEKYVAATLADVATLRSLTGGNAGALGDPIDLTILGPIWPDGAPNWLPGSGPDVILPMDGLVQFDDPQTGPLLINPRLVALVRASGPVVSETLLNLGTRTETIVVHLPVKQVQTGLKSGQ